MASPVTVMQAGRDLDERIAAVMGWQRLRRRYPPNWLLDECPCDCCAAPDNLFGIRPGQRYLFPVPCYSADIEPAWEVAQTVLYPAGCRIVPLPDSDGWWAVLASDDGWDELGIGPAPLAICLAALEVRRRAQELGR